MAAQAKTLLDHCEGKTILCFGDSLTHGMVVDGADWHQLHPYSLRLTDLIQKHFGKQDNSTMIVESGISGELASHMTHRLPAVMKKVGESSRPDISVVIILAGTNDLGSHHSAKEILQDVLTLHEFAKNHKRNSDSPQIFTLALSIPQLRWSVNMDDRLEVNKGLQDFVDKDTSKTTFFISLEEAFDQKIEENIKYWSTDMVHFSRAGYDKIGEIIFEKLKTIVIPS